LSKDIHGEDNDVQRQVKDVPGENNDVLSQINDVPGEDKDVLRGNKAIPLSKRANSARNVSKQDKSLLKMIHACPKTGQTQVYH